MEFSVVSLKTVKTNNAHHFSQAQEKNSSLNIFQASSIIFCGYSQLVLQRDATFRDSYPAETNSVHQSVQRNLQLPTARVQDLLLSLFSRFYSVTQIYHVWFKETA